MNKRISSITSLILAAVLVPNVLRYVEQARKANCQQEAASILTQTQADFAASQAEETGITVFTWDATNLTWSIPTGDAYKVGDVIVNSTDSLPATVTSAHAIVELTKGTEGWDITGLIYNNGTYTSTWDGTWSTEAN